MTFHESLSSHEYPGYPGATTGFSICACGAYRACLKDIDGQLHWVAGCRACDKIKMLEDGVRIRQGSDVTMDPENLLARAQREEAEVERLRAGIQTVLGDVNAHNVAVEERLEAVRLGLTELLP